MKKIIIVLIFTLGCVKLIKAQKASETFFHKSTDGVFSNAVVSNSYINCSITMNIRDEAKRKKFGIITNVQQGYFYESVSDNIHKRSYPGHAILGISYFEKFFNNQLNTYLAVGGGMESLQLYESGLIFHNRNILMMLFKQITFCLTTDYGIQNNLMHSVNIRYHFKSGINLDFTEDKYFGYGAGVGYDRKTIGAFCGISNNENWFQNKQISMVISLSLYLP